MKQKLLLVLACLMMTIASFAGKEDLYVLYEGFESGTIPASWVQEYASGQQAWAVEPAATAQYPKGAYAGDYLVALRNKSTQTQHYVTRLVSPVMDLSQTFQPILVFAHAQAQRSGDFDTLRVYYRTSEEVRWIQLAEYTDKISSWKLDTIQLPAKCATYQVAFEGIDNFGRGIVLDDIIVRPMPTCEGASNITASGLTVNSATLMWTGSFDTDSFEVVLSTKELVEGATEGIVLDTIVNDFNVSFVNLKKNTLYYVYIKSMCGLEATDWVPATFRTKNIADVPFYEDFNKNFASGTVSHVDYWTHGTSIKNDEGAMEYMPFINQNSSETSWKNYSFSQTTCLVFSGARNLSTDVPAGEYVYIATPEMNVEHIQSLQVQFWGTVYDDFGDEYAGGLIVGVMTDPADFNTFVPVDTVYAKEQRGFDRYTVFFNNYVGDGKYIAFASNFVEKQNMFFLDDVAVTKAASIPDITDISVSNRTALSFTLNANLNGNNAFRVILARDSVNAKTGLICFEPDSLPAGYIVYDKEYSGVSMPLKIELDSALSGNRWQLYVQPVKGTERGAMSLPTVLMVPMLWNGEELFTSFEEDEACGTWAAKQTTNFGYVSNTAVYPFTVMTTPQNFGSTVPGWPSCLGTTYGYNSKKAVFLFKEQQEYTETDIKYYQQYGDYVALPQVDDLSNLMLQFYLCGYSDSYTEIAKVAVGVMTDPFDPSTFEVVTYCESPKAKQWVPCIVTFKDYKGTGKFPAIMADKAPKKYKYSSTSGSGGSYTTYKLSAQYVDAITLRPMEGCVMPTDLKAEPSDTSIVVSWSMNGMNNFQLRLFKDAKCTDTVASINVKDTNAYEVKGLAYHTLYYYNVTSLCEDTALVSLTGEVKTLCAFKGETIPYVEDFESYTGGSSSKELPACWNATLQKVVYSGSGESSTSYYPYIYTVSSSAHAGTKSFYFYGYANSSSYVIDPKLDGKAQYFTLPMMAEELNKLQVSFWMKAGGTAYVGDTVYVGVMSDPEDISTFDTITMIKSTAAYSEYIVRLDKYAGKGLYIAFTKTPRELSRSVYMDDFKVDYLSDCEKIQGVTAGEFNSTGATITWTKGEATQWEVVLTKSSVEDPAAAGAALVKDTVVNAIPLVIDYCPETNTQYYVYVRALCSETNKGDWSNEISFKTTCVAQSAAGYGLIDFAKTNFKTNEFPCWTVGRREGTTAVPSITDGSHLYMFNTAASEGAYAIMPPIDVDSINRLQVKFTAAGGTGAAYLRELTVGIITNPNDLSTFQPIEVVKLPLVTTTISKAYHTKNLEEAQTYIVRFNNYFGDYEGNYGKQIMFLSENGGVANYVYIYSMQVDTIPTCWEPLNFQEVEVNTFDATMAWDSVGAQYNVQLLDASKAVVVDSLTNMNQMKFEGLEMLTTYYIQVRNICQPGDTSAWSPMGQFTTQCPVAFNLPFEENFDSYTAKTTVPRKLPNCWTTWYDGADAQTASTAYCYMYATAKKGTAGNGFYMGSTTGNAAGTTPAKPSLVTLPAINGLQTGLLHFYAKAASTTGTRALKIGMAEYQEPYDSIMSTVVWIDSVETIGKDWTYFTFDLSAYKGAGKNIVMMNYGGNTSATTLSTTGQYVYIDEIYVEKAPSCFRPLDAIFKSATANSLTFSWTPQGNETQWDAIVVEKGAEITGTETIVLVDTTVATMTGLQDSKEYDFYVRANCGAGDVSEWSAAASAQTLCRVNAEDAAWNFDDAATQVQSPLSTSATYKLEKCWIVYNTDVPTTVSNIPYNNKNSYSTSNSEVEYVSSKYAYSDSCALKLGNSSATNNGAYAVLPELVEDLDTLQISFKARAVYESYNTAKDHAGEWKNYYYTYASGSYAHTVHVGVMTDPYDAATFEELTSYQLTELLQANCSTKVEGDYWEDITVSLYQAKGKYIAFSSKDSRGGNYFWVDDVKVEKESGLNMPTLFKVDEDQLTGYSIPVTWVSRANEFQVIAMNAKGDTIANEAVAAKAYTLSGLTPTETYTILVSAKSGAEISKAAKLTVTTPCVAYTKDEAKWDFKNANNPYTGSTSYLLPVCWDGGITVGTGATYSPQAILNTANYQYSREPWITTTGATQDRALRFYNGTTTGGGYVIMPELNIDEDSTALHFYMRAAYFYTATYTTAASRNKLYTANSAYEKTLVVGAIADETDMTTFVALDTITYPYNWTSNTGVFTTADETGNDYWYEVVLPLKKYNGKGKLVMLYPANGKTGYMFVDDVEVIDADFCTLPTGLRAQNITSNSAQIAWSITGKDSVQVQVAKDEEFSELIVDSVVVNADGLFLVEGLEPGTKYIARAMHFCSEEESSDWAISPFFTTFYNVRFSNQFTEVRTYPTDWVRANSKLDDVFTNGVTPNPIAETATAAWLRQPVDEDMYVTTGTYASTTSSTGENSYWLITPVIDLSQQAAEDSLMLSFELRLTNNNNQLPYNEPAEDDKFIVAVSVDGGVTYKRTDATFWGFAETDDRSYNEIGAKAKMMYVEMTQYIGKMITIGFFMDSKYAPGKGSSKNYVHMDNVQLNTYTKKAYATTICQWEDYSDDVFTIDADELIPGATTLYEQYKQSNNDAADRFTQLSLTVVPEVTSKLSATVCYGADYMENNFTILGATKSAVYKQKLTGTLSCDSTVILDLTVMPLIQTTVEKTICQGDFYEFNGVKYYTNTIHTDTLVSMVTGCDSLTTLYLTVNAILEGVVEEHLCPGDSIEFGKYGKIGKAGVYVDTVKNALGCDSVATLIVHKHQNAASTTRALILQGEKYSKGPWQGLGTAGDYPVTLETIYGCDSIATLHLMVADASLAVTDHIAVKDLPYVLNDVELLPEGTAEGTYTKNVQVGDYTVTLTIVVESGTGLWNVYDNDMTNTVKVIENDQLIIIRNGKRYNAVGGTLR